MTMFSSPTKRCFLWGYTLYGIVAFGFSLLVLTLASRTSSAQDNSSGAKVYREKCASCHGGKGEGTTESYPHPLVGERSVGELAEYIAKSMPEDKPGTCVGDEARAVAKYVHETFYSPTAQARNKPVRVELSRLTVTQYRNVVADLMATFRGAGKLDGGLGLRGEYFKGRRPGGRDRVVDRVDPVVAFDFRDRSPVEGVDPHEFSIRWEGAVTAPDTGEYEFLVRCDHSLRLWVNDLERPLIDAYVRSGKDNNLRGSMFLLGGRQYALRVEFSKAKQGVNDNKAKEKPPAPAMISLEWKRPHRETEIIPSRYLSRSAPSFVTVLATPFPPDDRSVGWEKGTSISKEWDQATTDAAIEMASQVADSIHGLAGTKSDDPGRTGKIKAFCYRFAETAFRRPLSDELRQAVVDQQFVEAPNVDTAVKRVVLLVMKSPRFLYREVGDQADGGQSSYDVASRMAFGVWDAPPDQTLLNAAAKGELATRAQVESHARRMLNDPRTRTKLRQYLMTWLKIEHVPDVAKDSELFPDFNATVAHDLRTSMELFLDDFVAGETADFRQLLLADSLYLNDRLAAFYGIDRPADALLPRESGFERESLDAGERAGVLTHPYLMAGFAYTATSSPIHRGVFLSRSLLGRSLRPPPEAVAPLSPQLRPELSTRDRIALQTKPEACQTCHAMINPLGFTLEHFDAVGRFRKTEQGKPVDSSGSYRTRSGETVHFKGVRDLARFLADSPETHAAFVEQLFQGFIKQPIRAYGTQTKESLKQSFVQSGFDVKKLLVEIVATSALPPANQKTTTAAK